MALKAMIFDVDGTLVDTNRVHVEAWWRAFQRCGYEVPVSRIAPEIGKGGDMLVPAVLGEAAEKESGEALRNYHNQEFLDMAAHEHFEIFPRIADLFRTLHERGLKVALATSAKPKQLEAIEKSARIEFQPLVDLIVTAEAAEKSKPAPDIIAVTVKKLGLPPQQCAMVGDSPYDAQASRDADVICFGVLTGGFSREKLLQAGVVAVWQDTADLLKHLDVTLGRATANA
ncbi:MAG: HAD family hydrolase [Abitibacteriaceae bacterium]|nr:HAD family hydrolase [Abditibacteriaceae bacterium]MBV9864302.1 HAD family hydrolase [Abditibacteriaceae bacterium]